MLRRARVEGLVGECLLDMLRLAHDVARLVGEAELREPFPDEAGGLRGGVDHVFGIEAVVAQLVEQELVGGEVGDLCGEGLAELVGGHEEHGLAQLVGVHAVAHVPDGAYGEDDLEVRVAGGQAGEEVGVVVHDFLHAEPPAVEEGFGLLVAVGHDASALLVDPGGAEGQHQAAEAVDAGVEGAQAGVDALQGFAGGGVGEVAVVHRAVPASAEEEEVVFGVHLARHGLAQGGGDGERVVEDAEGIHIGRELGVRQPGADIRGEAGTHQQEFVRLAETGQAGWQFNGGEKIHRYKGD